MAPLSFYAFSNPEPSWKQQLRPARNRAVFMVIPKKSDYQKIKGSIPSEIKSSMSVCGGGGGNCTCGGGCNAPSLEKYVNTKTIKL